MKKYIYVNILLAISILLTFVSCKKISQDVPENIFTEDKAITSPQDVQNLLNSCYDALANRLNGNVQSFNDLMSDDLVLSISDAGNKQEIYNRSTIIFNDDVKDLYYNLYLVSFRVNNMELYYDKVNVPAADQQRMRAEGKFLRALCHFEVAKLWAQPSGFTPDNAHNGIVLREEVSQTSKPRATLKRSYEFIISDLVYAIENLPARGQEFIFGQSQPLNGYANKDAAKALLAKVYYMRNLPGDAALAIQLINEVIPNYTLSDSVNHFNNAASSSEYIFKMISTRQGDNRAAVFIDQYRCDTKNPAYTITRDLYTLLKADTADLRGKTLVRIFNAGKETEYYGVTKFNQDYFSVPYLLLTDLLLIRAELAAENGDLNSAVTDVNLIATRAHAQTLNVGLGQAVLLQLIRLQRRLEFFAEGDRLQNLKRRGLNPALIIRNAPWDCPGMVLQFHAREAGPGFEFNGTGGCN